jgi:hypothetical protein
VRFETSTDLPGAPDAGLHPGDAVLGYAFVRFLPGCGVLILFLAGAVAMTTALAHVLRSDAFPRVLLMPLAALAAASLMAMSASRLEAQATAKVRAKWQQRHAAMDVSRCAPSAAPVNR